jgi:hypothetical protein
MRNACHKAHLQVGQALRLTREAHQHGNCGKNERQYAGRDRQIAPLRLRDQRFERPRLVAHQNHPASRAETGLAYTGCG